MQEVTLLLLFAIFAISARFVDDDYPPEPDRMWEAGCEYLDSARDILGWYCRHFRVAFV